MQNHCVLGLIKIDGFIRVFDGTRNFLLFGPEKYDASYKRGGYLLRLKSGITYVIPDNYARIEFDSFDSLPLEKTLTLHNVTINVKPVLNRDQNHFYYNIFLEKCLYQLAKKWCQKHFWYYNNVEIWPDKTSKRKFLWCKKFNKNMGCWC